MWLNFDENDIQLFICYSPLIKNDNNDDDDDYDDDDDDDDDDGVGGGGGGGGGGSGAGDGRDYHLGTAIINCLYVRSDPGSATNYRA